MATKSIAMMIRFFHALLWLFLFCGVLFSSHIRVNMICTMVILIGIMLWDILGYCFVNILENTFDPVYITVTEHYQTDASVFMDVISRTTGIKPEHFAIAFNYLIYLVLCIGMIRIYSFMTRVKY